jgi:uncharacterized protein YhjY with autotransporter beta-barrel domain
MKLYFRRMVFWKYGFLAILGFLISIFPVIDMGIHFKIAPISVVYADPIYGTPGDDIITIFPGLDCDGIFSYSGNDIITINVGADVSKANVQSVDITATANATTIDAGNGNNQVTNNGSVDANAGANALPIDGSSSQAAAYATGIRAEDGADVIQNSSTIAATAVANSESGDISLTLDGSNQSQSSTTSTAAATGIAGGGGNNQITNSGVITVTGTSKSDAPFIGLNLTDTAFADVSVTAAATGTGISGQGSIVNEQTGTITVAVSSSATTGEFNANIGDSAKADANTRAEATATGIAGSGANDTITSAGTIIVNATSNAEGSVDLESSTDAEINATIEAKSSAIGIDGRGGDDTITNQSTLSTTSTASAASDNINTSIWTPGVTDTSVKSIAVSTGILSGSGKDVITNEGSITVYSEATTEVSSVLLSGGVEVALPTDVKGGATSEATAVGVDAGDGDDQITNNSTINASSKASTSSEGVLLTLVGIGTFATPTTATARSTGIDGGAGKDEITNSGTITANATSNAKSLSVSVSALQYEAASDGDAKTRSEAYATGVAGGDGDDRITNTGTVTANANATASTTDITVEGLGTSRSNSSTTGGAFATGINGGIGNDEISNSGTITANATSEVNAVGVDLKYIALPLQPAHWFGANLGNARTEAQATATGIDGGEGDDTISNSGTIDVYANAKADSDKIVSMLEIQSVSQSPQAAISGGNLQASPAVGANSTTMQATAAGTGNSEGDNEITNTGTIAQTTATGIAGGAGNDTIANNNKIYAKAESEGNSLSISATIAIGKGGTLDLIPDSAIIDATTKAQATVKGIDGNIGNDTITNLNEVNAEAVSNATSASIGVLFKGVTEFKSAMGIALSDATTKALSTATGIAGGDGDDTITNSGKIKSTATSEADSASISVALVGLKEGLVGGVSYADATTTAEATTIGMDGGSGNDIIANSGEIEVTAESASSSASIGVSASGAFSQEWSAAVSVAIADGTTKAISNAIGISSGDADDAITNSGKITAKALPDADSASVSVGIAGAEDGLTLGVTYADAKTTAEANAVGIDGGAGNDTIINTSTGQIEVTANPTSSSASVSATITGVTKGTGIVGGAALTDGTTKAISNVAGIKGGDGDDTIANFGKIIVKSNPDADSASVAVNLGAAAGELGLVGGFSYADATTTAQATAIGIDGGIGNDIIINTGGIEVTTKPTSSSASIAMTAQGVKGMGAAVGVSLTDGTTKAISTATGIAGGEGDDTITNSGSITVNALPDADSASVSVSLSAAKEGVAAGVTFADTTTIAQATATGIDGGEGNDTINNSGEIEVAANSTSSSASIGVTITGVKEGAGLGVALTDGTTKAISNATGINGGDGNNIIANSGSITVTATSDADSASVSATLGGTSEGLVAGVSYADATTKAEATAIGIETGRGDDIIQNDGVLNVTSEATATSASVAVNAGGAVEGAAVGVALTNAETKAKSSSTGIEGGEGENTITNTGTVTVSAKSDVTAASVSVDFEATGTGVAGGASLANGDTTVEAYAIGINNGSGKGTIINDNAISANAESTSTLASISVAVHGTPEGISLGAALASASNTAKASAIGIQGGNDSDIIANNGTITVSATTNADTTSVALDAECAPVGLGASLAKANTTAEAIATGLSGGSGDDEITNTGSINADSSSTASSKAISVSIATASYSSADVSTTATAKSTGIDGGSGADLLCNEGTIDLKATSKADGKAGSANLTGYAASDVDITAEATTTGIDGGAEYSDIDNLTNTGTIKAASDATAKGLSVSVNLLGGVATDANTTARAITTGIKGGAGDDQILNQGSIDLTAKSNADVLGVAVTLLGYADSNAESKAESTATGINAGDGVNTITSTGSIKVSSEAYADTASVSVNLLGYAAAKGGATASATAIGIASGRDADSIQNEGMINLNALSDTYASATSVQLVGYGESNAKGISNATVKGIDGGDGVNTLINIGSITGTATSNANASSYDIQLAGGAKATAGTEATATAIGIAGGKDMDTIRNEGTINLTAQSTLVSKSRSYKIFGVGFADADSKALATATGIDGGDGANTIANASTGSITVSSNASATATGMTANIGVAGSSASTTSKAHSTGIQSGGGEDTIINEGILNVNATSSTYAGSGDLSLIGLSFGDSLTEAVTDGINAGGGNDVILNTGSITVGSVQDNNNPMAYSNVDSVSLSLFNISSATFGSKAQATGIIGGGGDDIILNSGTITVGDNDWMAKGRGYGFSGNFFDFFSLTSVGATAETIATGIDGGEGNNTILNDSSGVLTVKATSYARTEGAADTTTFGSPAAFASSATKATATGISGGEGDDVIENKGKVDVYAYTWADAYSDSFVGWGSPRADSTADATATAIGIDAGQGQNFVTNSGIINVKALAETTPYAKANSDVDTTDAEAASTSEVVAYGIVAGSGDDVIQNQGDLTIEAVAEKATSNDQRTTAWTDEVAKVGTSKNNPGIRSSATAIGISAGGGTNQITNDGSITVKATATGDGYAFAESDAYDTETVIWAVVEASATGIATGQGSSQIINNGVVQVSSIAYSEIYSDSDSVDDADATGGATVTAKAWGINASGNNALVINAGTLDVDANATAKGNSRADSAGDGYGTAIFEANSNADAIGIAAGDGGMVWNKAQGQITVDAKAIIDVSANGDEFGTVGTSKENRGATARATAVGISMGNGDNQIINDGSISVNAEGNINANSRSLSTTRSTHTNTWVLADATATGLTVGQGESSIINTGDLDVNAKAIASLNDPNSGWGTYWRSDSWYNADAKTGAYAYSNATGIEASADNSGNPVNTLITNSGSVTVTSVATARGNAAGDRGGDNDGTATTYAEASAEATGFFIGTGNKLVSIENSGSLEIKSTADTLAFSHGDTDSWSYAKSLGVAYGIKVGDNNELVSIKNSGTMKIESTATSDTADDEPWRQSDASSNVYGINIGNSNSEITNSGALEIRSTATAKLYTDENTAVSTASSANATGISTGNGTNTISSNSQIQVIATAESNPDGGNFNSTNTATAQAIGIKTGSGSDMITLGTGSLINAAANAATFSYNGATNASAIGIDAGDGANQITNQGFVSINANATAEVKTYSILGLFSITYPATALSNAIGIKSGQGADIINNYAEIRVNSEASAVINQVLDLSVGTKSATANAIGIDAGGGDNFVANYGTIDVSALAAAGTGANPNARTDGVESTTAIGIKTGDGNDTIINSGTINTANQRLEWVDSWIHIISQPGIAITSGGGNDQVFLMNGSTSAGSIDLGDGDDWLTFVGTSVVTGNVTGANGIDTLVFDGAGSIGFTPMAFENAIKQGAGIFTVANLPTMQRIEIRQGTLEVNNNYQFSNSGFFQTFVNGEGSFGQFKVNGTTQLAGDLSVLKGPGPFLNGTTYNIIEANAVNNAFSNVMLPAPNNFVSFGMNQFPNLVQIEVYAKDFSWLARNRVEWAVANYLDRILPSATGDLLGMLGQIQNLSQSEFYKALSTLSPDSYDNFTRTTYSTTHRYNRSLQYRMDNVRSYSHVSQPGNEAPILLAYRGSDVSQLYNPERVSQIQGKNGLWLDVFGQWGDQGAKEGYTGFDYFMRGATLGFDRALTDKLMAGVSVGYSRADIDLDHEQGSGYIKSLYGSIYGSYFYKNLYIDGIFSYGRNWYDNHRLITIGTDQRKAYSKHDGDLFSAYLQGGYYFNIKKWLIGPFASLQYIYLDEESFKEKGAGGVSLQIDSRQTNSLVSELGVRLARVFKTKYGSLIPEVSAAWLHDFDIDDRVITSSFAGSPGTSFSIKGQDVEKNGATLGTGITFIHKSGLSTSFKYIGEFREKYKSNGVMGELRFTF